MVFLKPQSDQNRKEKKTLSVIRFSEGDDSPLEPKDRESEMEGGGGKRNCEKTNPLNFGEVLKRGQNRQAGASAHAETRPEHSDQYFRGYSLKTFITR